MGNLLYIRAKDVRDGHSILAHFEWDLSRHMCLEKKKAEIKETIVGRVVYDEMKCEQLRLELGNRGKCQY